MEKKSKQNSDWKDIIHNFVGGMLEQASDNIMQKIHEWIKTLKRKTLATVLMIFGLVYLLIGFSIYFNSVLGRILPGLGYFTVGVLAILVAYLLNNATSRNH